MKRPLLLLASICFISLTGCSKDDPIVSDQTGTEEPTTNPMEPEEPESPVYFTFTARAANENFSSNEKLWVVLHDSDGEFLDYKIADPGVELTFESVDEPVTDKVTVTLLRKRTFNDDQISTSVYSYADVKTGSIWAEPSYKISSPAIGNFDFYANNVPEWHSFIVTSADSYGIEGNSDSYSFQYPEVQPGNLRADDIQIYEENDFFFLLSDRQLKSKYMRLPDVQPGDSVVVDASQLLDFDKITTIDLPQHNAVNFGVTAFSNNNGVTQRVRLTPPTFGFDITLQEVELGYLNDFEQYSSYISIDIDDVNGYYYSKMGSPIDNITFPTTPTFNVTNNMSTDFRFTTNAAYVYQSTIFVANAPVAEGDNFSKNGTFWLHTATPESFSSLVTLPENLLTESGIYVDDFEYKGISIRTKSKAYDELLSSQFGVSLSEEFVPTETEFFSFSPENEQSAKGAKKHFSRKFDSGFSGIGHEFF